MSRAVASNRSQVVLVSVFRVTLIALSVLSGLGIFLVGRSQADEPTPRPTPTPQPHIALQPAEAVGRQNVNIAVTGYGWAPGAGTVILAWDDPGGGHNLGNPIDVQPNGSFGVTVVVPAAWAMPGRHRLVAVDNTGSWAEASFLLLEVPPTLTWTPTCTPSPTLTLTPAPPKPTRTPTLIPSHTPTPVPTPTSTPSPTLHPLTPIVTDTPTPRPAPRTPTATSQPGPVLPTPSATLPASPTSSPTATPTPSPSPSPNATPTSTAADALGLVGTATSTPFPTFPPPVMQELAFAVPSPVALLPTPDVGSRQAALPTAFPLDSQLAIGLPRAGSTWSSAFVLGFVAAVVLVVLLIVLALIILVSLVVAWRILRMRQAARLRL